MKNIAYADAETHALRKPTDESELATPAIGKAVHVVELLRDRLEMPRRLAGRQICC